MRKINFFAYITVALSIVLVYTFGELKYEKKLAKTKELWLLEDAEELEQEIDRYKDTIQILAKQNREYEIIIQTIKLKIAQDLENKKKESEVKPHQQSTIPSTPKGYPGQYIPRGHKSPNDINNPFAI